MMSHVAVADGRRQKAVDKQVPSGQRASPGWAAARGVPFTAAGRPASAAAKAARAGEGEEGEWVLPGGQPRRRGQQR